jgi:multiple sugar transport system substrate-binding protein
LNGWLAARARGLGLALALVAVLGGCGPRVRVTEVVFWQFWPAEVITPMLHRFEAENPGLAVRMERLSPDSAADRVLAAMTSGTAPDLCELGSRDMPRVLAARALSDWSAGVADLRPALRGWEMCSIGEAVYGLPWVLGTRALVYNKSLFALAGLDSTRPPATWEALRRDAAAIQRLGGGVHGFGIGAGEPRALFRSFMPFAWANEGELLSAGLDSSRFDSPENREALAFYLRLRPLGTAGAQEALDGEFIRGKLGLELSGSWLPGQIAEQAPGLRYGVALVPMPAEDRGSHASIADGEVLVGLQSARRKEAALRLARFLVRPENVLALAAAARNVEPASVGADTAALYRSRPERRVMVHQLEFARFTPNHPDWDAMEGAIANAVRQALADTQSPPESSAARATAAADSAIVARLGGR